ncbi:alpha/beta hydrolase fold domain-containing protein [Ketobacter sp.]|uniref:alpha/beta hydrolase fold domain-containing protein n=1 Tax=Ketobacter sp. TaxID=2083498 RepID=UPI000F1543B0|nr:alpha/beta hydrolase [Ketobacter sp.]RLT92978.1 MAG: steryl acetyl hydrolase [Ketobacter sp.]
MQSITSIIVELIIRHTGVKKRNNTLLPKRIERAAAPPNHPPPKKFLQRYRIEEHNIAGSRLWLFGPKTRPVNNWIYYIHGGAFVDGMMPAHWLFLEKLVRDTDALIAVPDYPLTPKANAEQAMDALLAGYDFFTQQGAAESVTCMGDSSGGGMCVVLAQQLAQRSLPAPAQLILLCPWLDISLQNPDIIELDKVDPFLGLEGLHSVAHWYSSRLGLDHPLANPMRTPHTDLPPITLFIGSRDLLQPDCKTFRDSVEASGGNIDFQCFPNMLHLWMFLPVKEAKPVYRQVIAKLNPHRQ